jgi:threonine dehydrogenase-like Zn-dependent dehydrogenase
MKAAVVVEPGRLELLDVPEPEPDDYQATVETLAGGLCGTDRHIVEGTFYRRDYPAVLGHESIGRVVEVGKHVRHLAPGDMVLRTSAARPGERLGSFASALGAFAPVALATDVQALAEDGREAEIKPYDRLQKVVPADFDPIDVGAFIGFKETLSWLRKLPELRGKRVLVIGTGSAGLLFVQLARMEGARQLLVLGRRTARLERARRFGADEAFAVPTAELVARLRDLTDGDGVDVVIEAAGTVDVLEAVPDALAGGGIVAVYGISAGQSAMFRWGWDRSVPRTWSLRFEEPDEEGIHDEALRIVKDGGYSLKSTLTHVLPFTQIDEALVAMREEGACKVAIDFRPGALPG